ncbi:MAG: Calx-beta domain-containing protein [Acidimicrobiia bacterium]
MGGGRFGIVIAGVVITTAGFGSFSSGAGAIGPCSPTPTTVLTGAQTEFNGPLAANSRVDATAATWTGTTSYPVYFDSGDDACWSGGSVSGTFGVGTSWDTFHGNTGIGLSGARFSLDRPRVFNYGDGIRARTGSSDFLIKNAYLAYIHDDCVQNDDLLVGAVEDSYLDGCYVAFSARRTSGTTFDGRFNTWSIRNSLVRLQAMPTVYSGSTAGHGGFFKWDENAPVSPKLSITNSIFRADQGTNHGNLNLPAGYPVTCSGNTVVWLGPGPFPGAASWAAACPGTVITTDRSVWDGAVRAWDVAHPGVVTGPEVSVGDASVIEGTSGTRSLRFPLSLSSPPAAGKTVTVYWSTAPGTAGTSDFTPTKGKAVFTGSQVFKMLSVGVKQDASDESNELMYLVAAGVDGGENHRERGTGTIVDDDPGTGVRLAISDATVVEGDSGVRSLVVPIALTTSATSDVLINWSTQPGTATAGSDYTTRSGTAKIAATKRFVYLTIPILADTGSEGTENFQVVVNTASGATVIDGTGVVTIRDDD